MKKCANCKNLYGRFGAWVGCELTKKEIKHPYLSKCPHYESCKKIKIFLEKPLSFFEKRYIVLRHESIYNR